MAITKVTSGVRDIATGEVVAGDLASTLDLSGKTVTVAAAAVTAHVTALPTQTSKDGYTLVTDGTNTSWEPRSNENIVINGGFDVWQRGTSFTSASYYQDYADRWMGDAHNTTGNTISRQLATASEPFYRFLRFQRDSGQTVTGARRVGTVFESQDTMFMANQKVTLSFYARKGANYGGTNDILAANLFTGTSANQSMSNGLGSAWAGHATSSTNATMTTSWQRFTHKTTIAATALQIGINFVTSAASGTAGAADYFDISGVKLELGDEETPYMNKGFGPEIARCQRYYSKSYPIDSAPGSNGAAGASSGLAIYSSGSQGTGARWVTEMRTTPTVTLYTPGGTSGNVSNTGNNADIASTAGDAGSAGFQYVSGSLPTGDNNGYRFHWIADAEL